MVKIPFHILSLFLSAAMLLSCGVRDEEIQLSGTIDIPAVPGDMTTPRFVAVARAEDFSAIFSDPLNSILEITRVEENSDSFTIDLSDKGLEEGSGVMIIAYTDRNFTNSVPFPRKDDYLGIYVKENSLDMLYRLSRGSNFVEMSLDRQVYDFDATIEGTLNGTDSGDVILAAYKGPLTSINFGDLNASNIIAYQTLEKGAAPQAYSLTILPYGHNVPIEEVFVCAILDRNRNGVPDAGDRMGFYSANVFGTPTTITVNEGTLGGIDISFSAEIGESAPENNPEISIQGSFTADGYDASTGVVYIFVSKADTGSALFSNVFDGLQYFERLDAGETTFDIDLAGTSLMPGDAVTVFAIWDKINTGGFVDPDAGDKVGIYQNKSSFTMSKTLAAGENEMVLDGDWTFNLDRTIYHHNMGISFRIEAGYLEKSDVHARPVTVFAVAASGVNTSWRSWIHWPDILPDYGINDMDKVLGMQNIVVTDFYSYFTLNFFSFISDSLIASGEFDPILMTMDSIYVFAVLDANGNGLPDSDEPVGYYYKEIVENQYYPDFIGIDDHPLQNEIKVLYKGVRFSSETY